jgi:LEA14-like dessication related protein
LRRVLAGTRLDFPLTVAMPSLLRALPSLILCAALACARPSPPVVTPEVVSVTRVDSDGVALAVGLAVYNPNAFPVTASSVQGTLWLSGNKRLGSGRAEPRQWIGARSTAKISSDVRIPWQDFPALREFLGQPSVPYQFRGEVTLGGDSLSLSLPFELSGQLSSAQLLAAGLRGLPSLTSPAR